jgi:hypothetical protein
VAITALPNPGAGLAGCLYAKNHKQKTARSFHSPDRFLFLWLFFIFSWLIP